jgi:hypothetical protein
VRAQSEHGVLTTTLRVAMVACSASLTSGEAAGGLGLPALCLLSLPERARAGFCHRSARNEASVAQPMFRARRRIACSTAKGGRLCQQWHG